jgi:hypothetical protein
MQSSPGCCFFGGSMKGKHTMEILIFAIVAGIKIYQPKKKFVPEPYPFQPLDIQTLKHVYNARSDSSNRSFGRPKSYAAQPAS